MDELIVIIKRHLKITWNDDDTNSEISELVSDAIQTMNHKLGIKEVDADYTKPGQERTLFKMYCLYVWNRCTEDFDRAYLNEILQLRRKYEVKYAKEKASV